MIVSLGGQTPLKLAGQLPAGAGRSAPAPSRSTWPRTASAGTRLCARLEIPQPAGGTATDVGRGAGRRRADRLPGAGAALATCSAAGPWRSSTTTTTCARAMAELAGFGSLGREGGLSAERPVLVDRFLEDAIEVDVDAIRDATGEVRHRRRDGARRGGRRALRRQRLRASRRRTCRAATDRGHRGLHPAHRRRPRRARPHQRPVRREGQPGVRASRPTRGPVRTVPFVAKATGVPLAKVAARVMRGATLAELRGRGPAACRRSSATTSRVKEAVLPFNRFPDADTVLGPEMRSTGEVMGIDLTVRPGLRQEPAGGRQPAARRAARSSSRWPTGTRRPALTAAQQFVDLGLRRSRPPPAPPPTSPTTASPWRRSSWPSWAEQGGADAVDLIASGQGAARRQHPPGPRPPRRRRPHPRARPTRTRCRCSPPPRPALAAADGMADWAGHPLRVRPPAGVPPRRRATTSWRARLRRSVDDAGIGRASTCARTVGSVALRQPGHDRVGDRRARRRAGRATSTWPRSARWWSSRSPPSPGPATRRPGCTRRRPACSTRVGLQGPGVAALAGRRAAAAAGDRRHRGGQHLGPHASTTTPRAAAAARRRARRGRRRRGQPVVPQPRDRRPACSPSSPREPRPRSPPRSTAAVPAAPLWAKLSADGDRPRRDRRRPSRDAGAEAVTLVNTVIGLAIDPETRRPRLGGGGGGLSGPAIHPVAVRAVHDVHAGAARTCPSSGSAASPTAADAVELLLAGASAVQVGTATFADPRAAGRIAARPRDLVPHATASPPSPN